MAEMSSSSDAGSGELCEICNKLNLETRNNREPGEYFLGAYARIKASKNCPFCCMIFAAYPRTWRQPQDEITTDWNEQGFTTAMGARNLVFLNEETATSAHGSARVVQPQIDPELMKKWLKLCETHHTNMCAPNLALRTSDNPSGLDILRVIDVQDQCIVDAAHGMRYIALSYVWGQVIPAVRLQKDNKAFLGTKGGLLRIRLRLPHTISDAIDLVGGIGERYLWIDNLCLVQDDEDDMLHGIAHMDLVYKGAILTIIAAQGTDANAGLPGLRPSSRKVKQNIVEVLPGVRMTTTRGVYDALSNSRYSTRGWTAQELILSHRCLIFADDGIWFRCRSNCWGEDTIY
ncbi:heterokaryon incompatibility protein-domain-containing protein, partial [Flammula alnicola]